MRTVLLRLWFFLYLVLGGFGSSWAACKMISPPFATPVTAAVTGAGSQGVRVHTPTISGNFTFKCDANTNYHLTFQDSGTAQMGTVTFKSASGTEIQGQLRLLNVCGKQVNTQVAQLPLIGYSGTVAAGQLCISTFDVVFPQNTVPKVGSLVGASFNAALQVILEY